MIEKVKTLISPHLNSQNISFLDILRDSTLHQYPTGNQPDQIMCTDETVEPWQNMDVEDSNLFVGHDSQDGIDDGLHMIIEDHVAFRVNGLRAEENAMPNPVWTTGFHSFGTTQTAETSVGTDAGMLEAMSHSQTIDWEQQPSETQQTGHAYLQGTSTVPAYTKMGASMLTSPPDVMALSQARLDDTQRLETANNTILSDSSKLLCSLPVLNPAEVPKRASKRKRIKTIFSSKKRSLTPSRLGLSEDSSASTTNLPSELAIRTESAAKTISTNDTRSSKQPNDDYPTKQPRWVPAREQGRNRRTNPDSAGIVKDLEISDSERRPMSWPHRNPWRTSLDISVAVLTKGFEKLMTERGESSSSAI